jgi:hypothetical protein
MVLALPDCDKNTVNEIIISRKKDIYIPVIKPPLGGIKYSSSTNDSDTGIFCVSKSDQVTLVTS